MRTWMIVRLALGGLRRTRLRVVLTSLGVAIASGALVSMLGFALGFQAQAEAPFEQLDLLNTIEVTPKRADDEGNPDDPDDPHGAGSGVAEGKEAKKDKRDKEDKGKEDAKDGPPLDDAAIDRMAALEGVSAAYPDLRIRGLKVTCGDKSCNAIAMGVPRQLSLTIPMEEMIVAGRFFSIDKGPEAILGQGLAKELGFDPPERAIGETVTIEASGVSPQKSSGYDLEEKQYTVPVVGIYTPPKMMPRLASRGIVLPVEFLKDVPGVRLASAMASPYRGRRGTESGYGRCLVRVSHPSYLGPVQDEIQAMGFKTRAMLDRLEKMRTFFIFVDVLLAAVGTVALVVASLGIVNTLVMSVLERTQEIGIYKAIGASDRDLLVLFLSEAGILGLLGGCGGLLLGRVVSWGLEMAANAYARGQGVTMHVSIFAFPPWLLAGTVLFAVALSVLAGVYPAMRAARVDPIRALRGN